MTLKAALTTNKHWTSLLNTEHCGRMLFVVTGQQIENFVRNSGAFLAALAVLK